MSTISTRARLRLVAALLIAALAFGATLVSRPNSDTARAASPDAPATRASFQVPVGFTALAGSRQASEKIPDVVLRAADAASGNFGAIRPGTISVARRGPDGTDTWSGWGSGNVCMFLVDTVGAAFSCAPEEAAQRGALHIERSRVSGGHVEIYGVVPDGSTSRGQADPQAEKVSGAYMKTFSKDDVLTIETPFGTHRWNIAAKP